jgi:hypothetical protein
MKNYYGTKGYEGPESIVVAMDIGTTDSRHGLRAGAGLTPSSASRGIVARPAPQSPTWNKHEVYLKCGMNLALASF